MGNKVDTLCAKKEVHALLRILELKDKTAYVHSLNVADIVESMLTQCTVPVSEDEANLIITGALLHDIGKAFLPFNISAFPGPLTKEEHLIIQSHTLLGWEVLNPIFPKEVSDICLLHHKRKDGTGYPANVAVDAKTPWFVYLIQTADIYEALTSPRPYKAEYKADEAFAIMRQELADGKLDNLSFNLLTNTVKK